MGLAKLHHITMNFKNCMMKPDIKLFELALEEDELTFYWGNNDYQEFLEELKEYQN